MRSNLIKILLIAVSLYAIIYPFITEPPEKPEPVEVPEVIVEIPEVESPEQPLHDVQLPDFASIKDIATKKKTFFDFIKPHVEAENKVILQQRASIEIALMMLQFDESLSDVQIERVESIFQLYKIDQEEITVQSLKLALDRVDIIPKELALMQAANESAWGTSRFARIGLNFFGQWCYRTGCGMIPKRRADEAAHEVAAFKSVRASVTSYFRNINTHDAYRELRKVRAQLRADKKEITATALTPGLMSYSERGQDYIEELNDMIRHNKAYFDEE
ncbi:glucosaminidase domain-containing protein [Pseudoalteromonas luteoviolacea]|uniref:glucosaminidase domain-containing protein n=1 Tax=Pseudoalteromonas luteoviolacea TaxID=43657 RepID=UPI001B39D987|nr:glucosaminidase domain-containing protein [Pseudoalteromonas luteoviolacea]MBQ4879407.1 glucosaminidase domain-containing protein [Pseudoalteromonas luteoviolacea]MBQ4908467.1 glucosaminidase domain-containing protein [Pseudoalteromonas luteoviolacea]